MPARPKRSGQIWIIQPQHITCGRQTDALGAGWISSKVFRQGIYRRGERCAARRSEGPSRRRRATPASRRRCRAGGGTLLLRPAFPLPRQRGCTCPCSRSRLWSRPACPMSMRRQARHALKARVLHARAWNKESGTKCCVARSRGDRIHSYPTLSIVSAFQCVSFMWLRQALT